MKLAAIDIGSNAFMQCLRRYQNKSLRHQCYERCKKCNRHYPEGKDGNGN